jgi:hypothetical protein
MGWVKVVQNNQESRGLARLGLPSSGDFLVFRMSALSLGHDEKVAGVSNQFCRRLLSSWSHSRFSVEIGFQPQLELKFCFVVLGPKNRGEPTLKIHGQNQVDLTDRDGYREQKSTASIEGDGYTERRNGYSLSLT